MAQRRRISNNYGTFHERQAENVMQVLVMPEYTWFARNYQRKQSLWRRAMLGKLTLGFVLLGFCGFATADQSRASGGYIGGAFGVTVFDDGGFFAGLNVDDEDTSLQLNGGYKILKHFAVEARYVDLGTYSVQGVNFDGTATSVHAIGIIPFGDSGWELFGQLGLGTLEIEAAGAPGFDEDVVGGGIGVRYSATQNFSLAVQTDVYVWQEDSTGIIYDMSVGGTQLSVQFIF